MGKHQEKRGTPIIVVKTRRTFSPPPYPKKQTLSHQYSLNRQQNRFTCTRNTYPPETERSMDKFMGWIVSSEG